MKVSRKDNTRPPVQSVPGPVDNNARKDAGPQSSGKPAVSISPMARQLQQLLSSQEPFDTQKVEKLKQLIAQGEYQVDVKALGTKLIEEIMQETGR